MVFSKFLGERPSGGDKYSGTFRTESIGYLSWYFDFRKIILSNSCESLDRWGGRGVVWVWIARMGGFYSNTSNRCIFLDTKSYEPIFGRLCVLSRVLLRLVPEIFLKACSIGFIGGT